MCDAKETSTILELKRIIEGILKVAPGDQKLSKQGADVNQWEELSDDNKSLQDYGFSTQNAKAQQPAVIALCFKETSGNFESVEIEQLSTPPPLPDVMRQAENTKESAGDTATAAT